MSESSWKKRARTGLTIIFGVAVLIFLFVLGLWLYVSATAKPLHPSAQDIPTTNGFSPPAKWNEAVDRSRPIVRAALADENLPGVSVAVGISVSQIVGGGAVRPSGYQREPSIGSGAIMSLRRTGLGAR